MSNHLRYRKLIGDVAVMRPMMRKFCFWLVVIFSYIDIIFILHRCHFWYLCLWECVYVDEPQFMLYSTPFSSTVLYILFLLYASPFSRNSFPLYLYLFLVADILSLSLSPSFLLIRTRSVAILFLRVFSRYLASSCLCPFSTWVQVCNCDFNRFGRWIYALSFCLSVRFCTFSHIRLWVWFVCVY